MSESSVPQLDFLARQGGVATGPVEPTPAASSIGERTVTDMLDLEEQQQLQHQLQDGKGQDEKDQLSLMKEKLDRRDTNEVGFDGEHDPYDPLNLPLWRKWAAVVAIGSGAVCV